jgi:hypothetical protein
VSSEITPLLESNPELKATIIKPLNFTNPITGMRENSSLLIPRDLEERLSSKGQVFHSHHAILINLLTQKLQVVELIDEEDNRTQGAHVINISGETPRGDDAKTSKTSVLNFSHFLILCF